MPQIAQARLSLETQKACCRDGLSHGHHNRREEPQGGISALHESRSGGPMPNMVPGSTDRIESAPKEGFRRNAGEGRCAGPSAPPAHKGRQPLQVLYHRAWLALSVNLFQPSSSGSAEPMVVLAFGERVLAPDVQPPTDRIPSGLSVMFSETRLDCSMRSTSSTQGSRPELRASSTGNSCVEAGKRTSLSPMPPGPQYR